MTAITKIMRDVAPQADEAAFIELHMALARKCFRAAFQRLTTAHKARDEGDEKTAAYFEEWADQANERGEAHLNLAVVAQRGGGYA